MIEMIWAFVVKAQTRGQFELAYGPGGAWSNLFTRCPGFRGITVLRDQKNLCRYLTIELWETEDQRENVLVENEAEYAHLEALLAEWIESKTEVGVFGVRAEATVRPRGRAKRHSRRTTR